MFLDKIIMLSYGFSVIFGALLYFSIKTRYVQM